MGNVLLRLLLNGAIIALIIYLGIGLMLTFRDLMYLWIFLELVIIALTTYYLWKDVVPNIFKFNTINGSAITITGIVLILVLLFLFSK